MNLSENHVDSIFKLCLDSDYFIPHYQQLHCHSLDFSHLYRLLGLLLLTSDISFICTFAFPPVVYSKIHIHYKCNNEVKI